MHGYGARPSDVMCAHVVDYPEIALAWTGFRIVKRLLIMLIKKEIAALAHFDKVVYHWTMAIRDENGRFATPPPRKTKAWIDDERRRLDELQLRRYGAQPEYVQTIPSEIHLPPLGPIEVDFNRFPNSREFPVDWLPEHLCRHVQELHAAVGVPLSLVASNVLATLSLACQSGIKVQRPGKQYSASPCSLFFITIVESGGRKTSVERIVSRAIRNFQKERNIDQTKAIDDFEADLEVWNVQYKALKKSGEKANEPEAQEAIYETLREFVLAKPKPPKILKLIHEDISLSAFKRSFGSFVPSTSLMSSEGLAITKSGALEDLGFVNQIWDGDFISIEKHLYEIYVDAPRLTLGIMIQPQGFKELLDRKSRQFERSGLLARCLIAYPPSMMGEREANSLPISEDLYFNITIKNLLEQLSEHDFDAAKSVVLDFDEDASNFWIAFEKSLEATLKEGARYFDIKSAAAKGAENCARLAALLHKFESDHPRITVKSVEAAAYLIHWYLDEMLRIVAHVPHFERLKADRLDLLDFLARRQSDLKGSVPYRDVAQRASPSLRKDALRRKEVLESLESTRDISTYPAISGTFITVNHRMEL